MKHIEIFHLARKAAYKVAKEYPGIEANDLTSAALTEFYSVKDKLNSDAEGYVFKVLYRAAVRYAAKERHSYLLNTATYLYRPQDVRKLLEDFFTSVKHDVPTNKDDLHLDELTITTSAEMVDLGRGLKGLKESHLGVIVSVFFYDEEPSNRMKVTRAIDALTKRMNGLRMKADHEHEGPGKRKVISNLEAYRRSPDDWNTRPHNRDAVEELQLLRASERFDPPGIYFDWGS